MFAGVALGEFADKSKLVFDEKEYIRDIQGEYMHDGRTKEM